MPMKTNTESHMRLTWPIGWLLGLMLFTSSIGKLRAHEDLHTHPALTVGAFLFLDGVAPEDASFFLNPSRFLVRQGSIDEDVCPNFISHFYNPKTRENTASDAPGWIIGCDRSGFVQQTAPARAGDFWTNAPSKYRLGETNLAMTKIGHVLHLLQDMTSPAHVHNDVHAQVGQGGVGCQDGDDFENWGWSRNCEHFGPFTHIFDYLADSVSTNYTSTNQITSRLATGLQNMFGNRPQRAAALSGGYNAGYSFVHELADKVYDFTTFHVRLYDTSDPFNNDVGTGELSDMFADGAQSGVEESGAQWWLNGVGYSSGECGGPGPHWWLMATDCVETGNYLDDGYAYIENTGGGSGSSAAIPDSLIPWRYPRDWYRSRYGVGGSNPDRNSMLRIYGDVLYTAAVAYGAGLLQTFLDEAIMPKPITLAPVVMDGSNARFNGQAHPGGTNASAWFEWGPDSSYGNPTDQQYIGNGSSWVGVSAAMQGLASETTYHCRLVSSNRFGVRYSASEVFRTPAFVLAGNGMNAWQITDNSSASGSGLSYATNLSVVQQGVATSTGWKLTLTSRLVTDFGDTMSINASYGMGSKRFLFWLDLDANGDLTVLLDGQSARKLTTNGFGATDYHTHEIQYANGTATYRFDGTLLISNWPGLTLNNPAGAVSWGAGSSGGQGQMNFHRVEFAIGGSNVVAAYNAGTAGNPAEAPNPISQGWTRLAGATPLPEGPLSPDGEPSLVLAETLAVSGLGLQGAQLNGRVDPRGSTAVTWFEWGLNAGYGNVAALPSLPATQGWTSVSAQLGALTQETTYHYRLVASNSFGIRFGTNRTFTTPSYLLTGVSPNAWQITDSSTASGSTYIYRTNLLQPERVAATNNGWRYSVTCRLTPNFQGTETMTFYYALGNTRFLVWWDLDASGNLTAELEGQSPRIIATNSAGATNFHTHELVYDPATRRAAYWFDGNLVTNWPGAASAATGGQIGWGAGSSGGRGQMNFHRTEFSISSVGAVALYDAGTAGNPAAAPNPIIQGWTLNSGAGPTSAAISPDVPFQPIADAETLAATAVGPNTAQLNASVNPRGQSTEIWFEWGTTAAYGTRTVTQNFGGSGARPVAQSIAGLTVDTTYHYRVVASNEFTVSFGSAQTFRTRWFQDSGIQLAAVDVGSVAWGDYDNDGDLDLIVTGQADTNQVTELYRNVGGTNFVTVNSGLPAVNGSAVAWGDYNNDGYLDLAISGWRPSGAVSRIYRNAQNGTFVDANAGLPGLQTSSVTWSDYDNDGDLDLLLTGLDDATTNAIARLYRNDRGTNFVDINAGLPGVAQGAVAWEDFDGDGDQDFVLTGHDNSQIQISRIYRNVGGGIFSDIGAELPGVDASSVAWGDYDSDGDPDLLLTGWNGGIYITHLFRNERNGNQSTFVDIEANLPGISASSVAWGDYDNDGDLDIVMTGWAGNYSARIFRNDGAENFADISADFIGVNWSSAAWADYDNDNDLDLLVTGSIEGGRVCRLYRNGTSAINAKPSAPSGLVGSGVGNVATVFWNSSTDDTTSPSTLSYNVILAAVTNGVNLNSPMSDLANGYRRVVRPGNAGQNQAWTFTGLRPGTYYFTVQAIDSAFAGGPFAAWQTLQVAPHPVAIIATDVPLQGQFLLQILGAEGSVCEVLRSVDLSTWSVIGAAVEVSPGLFEFLDTAAPAQGGFYRVRSTAP
jgi:sialidase-like protein/VCBS repeat protein